MRHRSPDATSPAGSRSPASPPGRSTSPAILSAAELGGLEVRVCERDGVVLREGETELARDVDAVATGLVARNGAGSVELLAEHFSDDPERGAPGPRRAE